MNEQNANGRNANGHRFRLYEIILGVMLTAMFAMLFTSIQRLANRVDALDRKVDEKVAELNRKVEENSRILVKMQTTLDLIASGLDIHVKPKEQAGPTAGPANAPAPNEQLATKDP
ncbi:MAG: hypothetical protein OXU53_07915 [Deltaproteobacteria bacterium]|nr:hypothetical protein [Deltaproteobacteria bacterium]